jgi:glycosyltransferase involved in cell wall biosynthesis
MATWTGVGRYTVGLARALAARGDLDLVQVTAAGERPPVAPHQGARSVAATKHPFSLAGARELGRIIGSVSPDVTHCTHFPTPMPAAHPLVVTLHDLSPLLLPDIMPSFTKRLVYRYWNGRATKHADRICVPSHFTASDVGRLFPAAIGKTRVTPEAADDFANGPMGLLNEGLAEVADWPYVLSMGSTRPHKDLPTLLNAFALIAVARTDLRLLLVGNDDYAYIDSMLPNAPDSVRERIVFTGRVTDPELRTLMAGARLFAFPSRYEGFGLPPLEAMEFDAPVVVADAASLPEVVGDAALLFAPGDATACADAMEHVLSDEALREDLIESGRRRASLFSWALTAEETVAVYLEAIGGEQAPPAEQPSDDGEPAPSDAQAPEAAPTGDDAAHAPNDADPDDPAVNAFTEASTTLSSDAVTENHPDGEPLAPLEPR